jgi:hypothetical protein
MKSMSIFVQMLTSGVKVIVGVAPGSTVALGVIDTVGVSVSGGSVWEGLGKLVAVMSSVDCNDGEMDGCSIGCVELSSSCVSSEAVGSVSTWARDLIAETISTPSVPPTNSVSSRPKKTDLLIPRIIDTLTPSELSSISALRNRLRIPVCDNKSFCFLRRQSSSVIR